MFGNSARIVVGVRLGQLRREYAAVIDTGFDGGLALPRGLAQQAGASRMHRPAVYPGTATDEPVPGYAGMLHVWLPVYGVGGRVVVYCPDQPFKYMLIGNLFLEHVGALLTLGSAAVAFQRGRRNATASDMREDDEGYDLDDMSWMTIPTDSPREWPYASDFARDVETQERRRRSR